MPQCKTSENKEVGPKNHVFAEVHLIGKSDKAYP